MQKNNEEDVSHLFKPGYKFKVEKYDFESDEIKNEIAQAHHEQAVILQRKEINPESLERRMTI